METEPILMLPSATKMNPSLTRALGLTTWSMVSADSSMLRSVSITATGKMDSDAVKVSWPTKMKMSTLANGSMAKKMDKEHTFSLKQRRSMSASSKTDSSYVANGSIPTVHTLRATLDLISLREQEAGTSKTETRLKVSIRRQSGLTPTATRSSSPGKRQAISLTEQQAESR